MCTKNNEVIEAKLQYCENEDKVFYIPIEEDDCPYCGKKDCLTDVLDEYGYVKGANVKVPKKYVIIGTFEECWECGEKILCNPDTHGEDWVSVTVYDDPWASEKEIFLHIKNDGHYGDCYDHMTDTSWAGFRYFTCDCCERMVARQCFSNGWYSYVCELPYGGEVCLACYEDMLLSGEIPPYEKGGGINGMFFDEKVLEDKGFECIDSFFINSEYSLKVFKSKADEYTKDGAIAVVNFTSMGIGGGEGYVELWVKGVDAYGDNGI